MPSKDFVAFDPLTILNELRDVEHIVVGGFAAVLYGAPTITGDLDIMPRADDRNIAHLAAVLARLQAVVREPRSTGRRLPVTLELLVQTSQQLRQGGQLRTRTSAGPLDILWHLHDGRSYGELVDRSAVLSEDDLSIRVIGLDDLIQVKKAIGRPQDLTALPYLNEIRRRR
jgi:hypothetical protein